MLLKFGDLFAIAYWIIDAEFGWNLTLFAGVMKMYKGSYVFPGHTMVSMHKR